MNFVLNTPAALIYLAVQNLISAEECLLLLQEPDSKGFTRMSDYPSHYIWLLTVIWTLKDFQEQTRKLPEVQRNQLAAYYIQNILEKEGISVIRATRGLHELVIYLKEGRLTEFMGQSWVKRLKSYDWQKDPGALFARYDPELGLHIRKEVYAMIGQIRPLAHFINEVQKKVVVDVQKKQ